MRTLQPADVQALQPSPLEYLPIVQEIASDQIDGLRSLRIAFFASFTVEPLRPYLIVEAASFQLKVDIWFSPFNQFEQQILDSNSEAYSLNPDVLVLALRIEESSPAIANGDLDEMVIKNELAQLITRSENLVKGIRVNTAAPILIWNFCEPEFICAGLADAMLQTSQIEVIQRANAALAKLARDNAGVYIFDARRLAFELGRIHWFDSKLFHLARIPFSPDAQRLISRRLARYLNVLVNSPRKCLVLDLDNTLWGGIVGEDGMGVSLGDEYPGSAFKAFQRYVASLKSRGVLLAIASKNNPEDALVVMSNHPDCLLRPHDFVAIEIGWGSKAESIKKIALQLNIGIDSLVFFDDSSFERELVRRQHKDVLVIDVPTKPLEYINALEESGAFDILYISTEDRRRSGAYIEQRERESFRLSTTDPEEFLHALRMRASIGFIDDDTLGRAVQMLAKTNQFNVTTRRHNAEAIQRFIDEGAIALWLRLEDKFGDNGLTGIAIARPMQEKGVWSIDSLLLSCRIIGRHAERVLVGQLCWLVRELGASELRGEYIPTAKNGPAASVFSDCGFVAMSEKTNWWSWSCVNGVVPNSSFIATEFIRKE